MKKNSLVMSIFPVLVLLSITLRALPAQETGWQLPVKNGLIQFEYKDTFQNRKKELCIYYATPMLIYNLQAKVNNELSTKGSKLLSTTNYMIHPVLYNADASAGQALFMKCNPDQNDTLTGSLTITVQKSSLKLSGVKNTFNMIKCKFRVVLDRMNKMSVRFRGFTVSDTKFNSIKGTLNTTETDLEVVYNEFLASEKKSKNGMGFFSDLKMIIHIFYNNLKMQMEKDIKIAEQD